MSIIQLRPRTLGLALLLAMATSLAGCTGSPQERDITRSHAQSQELRERALMIQSDR